MFPHLSTLPKLGVQTVFQCVNKLFLPLWPVGKHEVHRGNLEMFVCWGGNCIEAKGLNGGNGADLTCCFGFLLAGIEADSITVGNEVLFIYLSRCILAGR